MMASLMNMGLEQIFIFACQGVVQLGRSGTGLTLVDPSKVKASKFFLYPEIFPRVLNKEHLVDFVVTL